VFADINPDTFNLGPQATRDAARAHDASAILVVHLYGLPADMDALTDVAEDEDLLLVEDASQSHGALVDGRPVGSIGDIGTFSFYPTKNMTTGEGGMVVTDNPEYARRAASFINHGRTEEGTYKHDRLGTNYRMTSLAAAIGRVQLEKLPDWILARRENAAALTTGLQSIPSIDPPTEPPDRRHAYHQYTIRSDDRDELRDHLHDNDIQSRIYYPKPIHRLAAYDDYDDALPTAEAAAAEVLSLPVHPEIDASEIWSILDAVEDYASLQI
jgi:dTDP-4-amino-4,6-dideoxygalactose transaminase